MPRTAKRALGAQEAIDSVPPSQVQVVFEKAIARVSKNADNTLDDLAEVAKDLASSPDRMRIMDDLGIVTQPAIEEIRRLAPDARIGYRGSLARGFKGPHRGGAPFEPYNFDVDAFIVSDVLAEKVPNNRFRSGAKIDEIREIQDSIDSSLRKLPSFAGLRSKDKFTCRIYAHAEYEELLKNGDLQVFFIPRR